MFRSVASIAALMTIPFAEGSPNSQVRRSTPTERASYEHHFRIVRNFFGACKMQWDEAMEVGLESVFSDYSCGLMGTLSPTEYLVHEFVPDAGEPFKIAEADFPSGNKVNRRLEAELNAFINEYSGGYPGAGGYPNMASSDWAFFSGSVWKTHKKFACSVCSVEMLPFASTKVVTVCRFDTPFNVPGEFDQVGSLHDVCDACVGHSCQQPPPGGCTVSRCSTADDEPVCTPGNWVQEGGGAPMACDDGIPMTEATCVDGTGECRTVVGTPCTPAPVVEVNGSPAPGVAVSGAGSLPLSAVSGGAELVLPLRDFLQSTSFHKVGSLSDSDKVKLSCPTCSTDGCRFYIFAYHCPPYSTGSSGGLQSLLGMGWEARSCGPNFFPSPTTTDMQPTLIYRKDIDAGVFEEVVIEGSAPFVGVFAESQQPVGSDEWCSGQQKANGPFQEKVCKPIA